MSTTVNSSAQHVSSTTTPAHDDNTNSLDRRLDFISVAIICGIIVACFVLCFIIGCRRTKRRRPPRCQDVSTPPVEPSRSDIDGTTGLYRERGAAADRSLASRGDESPPPTYSIIERQTSFSSDVCSQTSSMIEIPPTYDDAYEPPDGDLDTSGQWYARPVPFRGPRPTDRSGSLPSDQPGVTSPTDKSGSLPHSRPPRVRSRRHYSDVTDPHRRKRLRMRLRPSPLTENDSEAAGNGNDNADLEVERSIDVIPEVTTGSPVIYPDPVPGSSERTEPRGTRPLLKDTASHPASTSV